MKEVFLKIKNTSFTKKIRFALVSDLHGEDPSLPTASLKANSPDYILCPGDIFDRMESLKTQKMQNSLTLLSEAAKLAPTFYSIGNHENGGTGSWKPGWEKKTGKERKFTDIQLQAIKKSGVILLDDCFTLKDGIAFGGLTSGLSKDTHKPDTDWLKAFCSAEAPRVLLCHHPEYYKKYLKDLPIDVIVSGHAHGGQWRVFGRGVFAPGQGIFPKYTSGIHDNRFTVSKGLSKGGLIPRIFNPTEIVYIDITSK